MYIENPYYHVYEVIIYWHNKNGSIDSFYKIGMIKVEREDRKLQHRFRREIQNGCKVFVLNQYTFDSWDEASKSENELLRLAEIENIKESKRLGLDRRLKSTNKGGLSNYDFYFAGETEAFRTPERLKELVLKLGQCFEQNLEVYYPQEFQADVKTKPKTEKS